MFVSDLLEKLQHLPRNATVVMVWQESNSISWSKDVSVELHTGSHQGRGRPSIAFIKHSTPIVEEDKEITFWITRALTISPVE